MPTDPHHRHDRSELLRRDIILIQVDVNDGTRFDMLLTRVPCLGEELNREDRHYKVVRVQHEPMDFHGLFRIGWHAFVDVELLPAEE